MTFRFAAPNATQVSVVSFGMPTIAMQKDAQGVWTGTSEPLAPEIYQYNFIVDGARVTDPSNSMFMAPYRRKDRSGLLVPGDNPWTPVPGTPRGAVAQHLATHIDMYDRPQFVMPTVGKLAEFFGRPLAEVASAGTDK